MSLRNTILHRAYRSDTVRRAYGAFMSLPILGTALRRIIRSALPVGSRVWIQIPCGLARGCWIYADPRTEAGYTNGDHEPWVQELLQTELRPGGCYYDVGAHSGFFALIAARRTGSSGVILAFEPDPKNRAILEGNVSRNSLSQIRPLGFAAWSSTAEVTFESAPEASNGTQGHICSLDDATGFRIAVPAVTLDDLVYVRGFRAPDLIKLDVEGAEWEALQGARRLLVETRPKLLCEIHHPEEMARIHSYLQECGYAAEEWRPVHPHYADYQQLYLWAVPRLDAARGTELTEFSRDRN